MCKYLTEILNERENFSAEENNITGNIKFKIGYLTSTLRSSSQPQDDQPPLYVQLESVHNLRPRTGRQNCNFSLTVTVLPVDNEKGSLRERTAVFHERTSHIFDLTSGEPNQMVECNQAFFAQFRKKLGIFVLQRKC